MGVDGAAIARDYRAAGIALSATAPSPAVLTRQSRIDGIRRAAEALPAQQRRHVSGAFVEPLLAGSLSSATWPASAVVVVGVWLAYRRRGGHGVVARFGGEGGSGVSAAARRTSS
ncbi:hypothetical protein [Streptomyces sp. NPDC040750]|uniref:hypothetical protein n=1 Tax=Streptomyces sp. NPDC040750 TaxID=3154491 RepID=UPI0033F95933